MSETQNNLQELIKENAELKSKYNALHCNYDDLQSKYAEMVKRVSDIEARTLHTPLTSAKPDDNSSKKVIASELSQMKGDALNISASIRDLQDVWSHAENKLDTSSSRLHAIEQQMRKNSLLVHGLNDIPVKTYGLEFSEYKINKLKELLPTIADKLKIEDVDVSHPLRTKSNNKSCVIIKFVRRDIKNLIFYEKRELKKSPQKISITEHLTAQNLWYLDEARSMVGFKNTWSSQCVVYALVNGKKIAVRSSEDLNFIYHNHRDTIVKRNSHVNVSNNMNTSGSGNSSPPASQDARITT